MQTARALLYSLIFYPGTLGFVIAGLLASLIGQAQTEAVVLAWFPKAFTGG